MNYELGVKSGKWRRAKKKRAKSRREKEQRAKSKREKSKEQKRKEQKSKREKVIEKRKRIGKDKKKNILGNLEILIRENFGMERIMRNK